MPPKLSKPVNSTFIVNDFFLFLISYSFSVRSLKRALDRRLYLLLYGSIYGAPEKEPVWHFPEKVYENEETLRKVITGSGSFICWFLYCFSNLFYLQCAESALESILGDLSHTYFVGNAPFAHMVIKPAENMPDVSAFKVNAFVLHILSTTHIAIGVMQWLVKVLMDFTYYQDCLIEYSYLVTNWKNRDHL